MVTEAEVLKLADMAGFEHSGSLRAYELNPSEDVRTMCEANRCRMYGRSWSCPPAVGSLSEIRKRLSSFEKGVLLQTTGLLEDSFDYESMREIERRHKDRLIKLCSTLPPGEDFLALSSGVCSLCDRCSYPDSPCRMPEKMMPSMEAFGLIVSDVCTLSGVPYNYGGGTVTYTGCLLFHDRSMII